MNEHPEAGEPARSRTIAFVFPGQGSQYVGMGAELIARSPAAADAFERADAALGMPISRMILEGPAEELDRTVNAQPAILATSYAFLEAIRAEALDAGVEIKPTAMAGHSAGQYAAAVAADAIDYADALRLVRERGRIMQERGIAGGMGAVIGLSDEQVHEIVEEARQHGEISVANANAPGPDRAVGRDPGPGLRARDEQDGGRPQGRAAHRQRRQPLPAHAPRPRRVRTHPGQGPLP